MSEKAINVENENSNDVFIVTLTIACIISGFILTATILFYGYIRLLRINPRNNAFERHEMSLQGPILEVDNNGFIPSDFNGVNFKENLNETLQQLDSNQVIERKNLSLDIDNIIGIGCFGDIIKGQLNRNSQPTQVHVISTDDLENLVQVKFIRSLQNLLQFGYHSNLLSFCGICRTSDWFFVVFEDTPSTLKQFLLSYRNTATESKLTSFAEDLALRFVYDLANVLEYLRYNKIVHKNLNTHNIRVSSNSQNSFKILISIFGPTLYSISDDGTKNMIDDDRYFAPEVLRFQKFSHSSDVYSFALIAWEVVCVGGTIYQAIITSDLYNRIKKGIRPEKYGFISDDLYQMLLNCWDLEPGERFNFKDIVGQLKHFLLSPQYFLNYSLDGPLPFYLPLLEFKN